MGFFLFVCLVPFSVQGHVRISVWGNCTCSKVKVDGGYVEKVMEHSFNIWKDRHIMML